MKSKKILAGILAVTMMFGGMAVNSNVLEDIGFGITASAEDKGTVDCSTNAEIKTALSNLSEGDSIVINVTSDTTDDCWGFIYGSNITVNLNGHTLNNLSFLIEKTYMQTLTINGGGGKIIGIDPTATIVLSDKNKLIANNVSIIGRKVTDSGEYGSYGIICCTDNNTVELNNCYVSSGVSTDDSMESPSALVGEVGTTVKVKDTTFTRQNGVISSFYPLIHNATLIDFDGNKITNPDYTISTFKVGLSSITQEDKSPAQAQTPVTAKTNIPEPTYTVTIPADVDFGSQTQALEKYRASAKDQFGNAVTLTKNFTVSATGVGNLFDDLGKKSQIDVKVTYNGLLADGTNTVPYDVKTSDDKAFASESVFCSFKNTIDLKNGETNSAAGKVSINRCDITNAGSFTGTMTFDISIPDAN